MCYSVRRTKAPRKRQLSLRPSHAVTHPTNGFWASVDAGGGRGGSESVCLTLAWHCHFIPAANTAQSSPAAELMAAAPSSHTEGFFSHRKATPTPPYPHSPPPAPSLRTQPRVYITGSGRRAAAPPGAVPAPCRAGGAQPRCHVGLRVGLREAKAPLFSSEFGGGKARAEEPPVCPQRRPGGTGRDGAGSGGSGARAAGRRAAPLTPRPSEESVRGPRHVADHLVERLEVAEHLLRRLVRPHRVDDLRAAGRAVQRPGGRRRPEPRSRRYLLGHLLHLGHVRGHGLLLAHPAQAVPRVPAGRTALSRGRPTPRRPTRGRGLRTTYSGRWGPRSRAGAPGSGPPSPACSSCRSAASPRRKAGTNLAHRNAVSAAWGGPGPAPGPHSPLRGSPWMTRTAAWNCAPQPGSAMAPLRRPRRPALREGTSRGQSQRGFHRRRRAAPNRRAACETGRAVPPPPSQ